jgi:hypothetical protein
VDGSGAAEQRLADALRARAVSEAYSPSPPATVDPVTPEAPPESIALRRQVLRALVVALLVGLVLGAGLGLLSLYAPGFLPIVG